MKRKKRLLILVCCVVPAVLVTIFLLLRKPAPDFPLRIWSVSLSPDGKLLATGGGQTNPDELPRMGELIFWNIAKGKKKRILRQASTIRSVAWAPDGKFVAIGDFAGSTRLVEPETGKTIATLPPHAGGFGGIVNAVGISADSVLVASASTDGTVTLWDMTRKELDPLILPQGEKAFNVAVSPNHSVVVVGGRKGKAYLYSLAERGEPLVLQASKGPPAGEPRVEAVAFSADGLRVATGCQKTLRVWETGTGSLIRDLSGTTARVNSLAFSHDGQIMAAVDNEGQLVLWNAETGEFMNSAAAHTSESFSVAFSRDGKLIATAGRKDFTAKIWDAPVLRLRTTLYRTKPNQVQGVIK